jgi:hypothetical protein
MAVIGSLMLVEQLIPVIHHLAISWLSWRFFHPSAKIREQFSNNDKHSLKGVVITGQGTFKVNCRQQECYCVCINQFDDGTIFHIVKGKLCIDQAAAVPFAPPPASDTSANIPRELVNPDRSAQTNA